MKPMDINCLKCGEAMHLLRNPDSNYAWQRSSKCLPPLDTGVATKEDISDFEKQFSTYEPHNLVIAPGLDLRRIAGAKVYAARILTHFIECTWGGCYNSIYFNFLVPHFDSVAVLDYVLRTPVVSGDVVVKDGIPEPKMFGELFSRLGGVRSPTIRQYLNAQFSAR